jgi:hypothetical protein
MAAHERPPGGFFFRPFFLLGAGTRGAWTSPLPRGGFESWPFADGSCRLRRAQAGRTGGLSDEQRNGAAFDNG